MLAMEPADGPL